MEGDKESRASLEVRRPGELNLMLLPNYWVAVVQPVRLRITVRKKILDNRNRVVDHGNLKTKSLLGNEE